ncbi:hypothetical protein EW146_g3658 [Bondarzewia mesenterica]|uniref:Uncharacterized protein n=1 Tax=Bondarzewia mesenterica TaxID=1095465 RepID=A0A4S4LWX0_9AGAM|nr:hypothetical protein EW146_g3658 [Bondarzewia mesenterica]
MLTQVFTCRDGTITTHDTNDFMIDNMGYGQARRRAENVKILDGSTTFRDAFRGMLESIVENGHSFDYCKQVLKENIVLDSGFKEFYQYCKSNDIPFVIVSSGMKPLIQAILANLVGEEDAAEIEIISNEAIIKEDGSWHIHYRHPSSGFGHDKSQAIIPYRELENPPTLFFFGDGVSDMSAAKHADVLFVKLKPDGDSDLAKFVVAENIPHVTFTDFSKALGVVHSIVSGEKTKEEVLTVGRAELLQTAWLNHRGIITYHHTLRSSRDRFLFSVKQFTIANRKAYYPGHSLSTAVFHQLRITEGTSQPVAMTEHPISRMFPPLNHDCALYILDILDTPSLLSLASTSRIAMTTARRFLVQDVVLRDGAEQYSAFCEFVLLHDLTRHVRCLTIGFEVIRDAGYDKTFFSSLAEILEKAEKLRGFVFEGCICRFHHAAQIASALVDRPLSELSVCMGLRFFRDRRPITGLRVLSVGEWRASGCDLSALSILSNILTNNAHTLESLTMPCLDNYHLARILWPCPHVHTLHVNELYFATAEEVARAFPYLRSLDIKFSNCFINSCIQTQSTLWPSLTTVNSNVQVIMALARHHALQRVTLRDMGVLSVDWLGGEHLCVEFLDAIRDCPLETLSLDAVVSERGDVRFPLLSRLASSVPNLKCLAFHISAIFKMSECLQMMISPHINALGDLRSLRYATLSMDIDLEPPPKYAGALSPEQERDAIVRHWFTMIPSLEYLELKVKISDWPVTWWRRRSDTQTDGHLREESDDAGGVISVMQISKEEGKAARDRYWQ